MFVFGYNCHRAFGATQFANCAMAKMRLLMFCLIATTTMTLTLLMFARVFVCEFSISPSGPKARDGYNKTVLVWDQPWEPPGPWRPSVSDCGLAGFTCIATMNRTFTGTADAVVFSWRHLPSGLANVSSSERKPFQKYVFLSLESPAYYPVLNEQDYNDFFNWTISYRLDSDIPYRYYGHIAVIPSNETSEDRLAKLFKTKMKIVAQFVSNCRTPSRRELITAELNKHIPVDVYGGCGNSSCSRSKEEECRQMIERDYFFYLAFENSICTDYVTEKLYYQLEIDIVPIVLSRRIASVVAPHDSFIAVDDFGTVEQLADYLRYLSENATAYGEYFDWKRKQAVSFLVDTGPCLVCKALLNPSLAKTSSIESIFKWWNTDSACRAARN